MGEKLILCNKAVKRWDEEVKEAIRVRRETHTRCLPNKSTVGWEEYAEARTAVKKMIEKKKKDNLRRAATGHWASDSLHCRSRQQVQLGFNGLIIRSPS